MITLHNLIPQSSVFREIHFNGFANGFVFFLIGFLVYIIAYALIVKTFDWCKRPLNKGGLNNASAISASIGITVFLGLWLDASTFSVVASLVSFAALLTPWAHKIHL